MKLRLLFVFVFLPVVISKAQLSSYDYNGYAKYLFGSTRFPDTEERYSDHLIHTRINTRWYATDALTAAIEFRFRAFYGETIENTNNYIDFIKTPRDWVQLDAVLWDENKSIGYLEVDRFWLNWIKDDFEITIGRQRIAWGTAWVWNPTDIFNPLDVLDFDYEERPAADAVRLQYYTGAVTKLDIVYKPAKDAENQILAGLWSINKWNYDFNLIAGMRFKRWLAGFSWAGDVYGGGFRGEVLVSKTPAKPDTNLVYQIAGESSLLSWDKPMVSASLSGDYTFPNTFYIHTEVLYNNNGKTSKTFLFLPEAFKLGMLTAARWSLYQEFAYDITPLIRGSVFGIINPNDKSYIIVPSISYSVLTNLDLTAIGFFFKGDPLTEFGEYETTLYIRFKYSF